MERIVLFGAGNIGRRICTALAGAGAAPACLSDNNRELWGTFYEGIEIVPPGILKDVGAEKIFITCKSQDGIREQLFLDGIAPECVYDGSSVVKILQHIKLDRQASQREGKKVLFDLQLGLVLGGVESWTFQMAERLQEKEFYVRYLTTNINPPAVAVEGTDTVVFDYCAGRGREERIMECVQEILRYLPCNMVINFASEIFEAACMIKGMYPELIRLIAVVHSDYHEYYDMYGSHREYIDEMLVISSRIKERMIKTGFPENKMRLMQWEIPCKAALDRDYSKTGEAIRLGYAGRITIRQKRADRLLELAGMLRERNICFILELAGEGDYERELREEIKKRHLKEQVILSGFIKREELSDFWERQDIMVSCSEVEGHSISQSEAMAGGAVPVITDVSGAEDDVRDGYNGFIVAVGDMETFADRISELYDNRSRLCQMGKNAHGTMYARQKDMEQGAFWDSLLREAWE